MDVVILVGNFPPAILKREKGEEGLYSKVSIYASRRKSRKKNLMIFLVILLVSAVLALGISFYWVTCSSREMRSFRRRPTPTGPKEVPG